ncbi:MAG: DUF3572 domain-containing protein [Rhodobacteraceae bacterium]|nr:DUF3572 domain-containing protein [Paracoccaceae bacterium]
MKQDQAEVIGLQALGWLIGNDDLRGVFLGASGASVDDLKTRAGDSDFLASILDFILMDDAHIIGFCDANSLAYDLPMQALHSLPGQGVPNWT